MEIDTWGEKINKNVLQPIDVNVIKPIGKQISEIPVDEWTEKVKEKSFSLIDWIKNIFSRSDSLKKVDE